MAYNTDCGALQLASSASLDILTGGNTPQQKMTLVGFLAKLAELNRTSPLKLTGTRMDGGKKVNRVLFDVPESRFDVLDQRECTTTNQPCPSDVDVVLDQTSYKLSKFSHDELRALTEELGGLATSAPLGAYQTLGGNDPYGYVQNTGNQPITVMTPMLRYIANKMAQDAKAVLENVDIKLLQLMHTFIATAGGTYTSLPMVKAADGALINNALTKISFDFTEAQQAGTPIVVGNSQILHSFFVALQIACCNDAGLNPSTTGNRTAQLEYWRDQLLQAPITSGGSNVFGANQFFVMSSGAARFVQDNNYVQDYAPGSSNSLYSARTVEIGNTGIFIDQEIEFSTCDKVWTTKTSIPLFGLFIQPLSTRSVIDPLYGLGGSSGIFPYTAATA